MKPASWHAQRAQHTQWLPSYAYGWLALLSEPVGKVAAEYAVFCAHVNMRDQLVDHTCDPKLKAAG